MGEPFEGFKFCDVLDGLLCERTSLTAMKVVTMHGGAVYWLHRFLVNRALGENLRLIKMHECALCQYSFRDPHNFPPYAAAYQLMEEQLTIIQKAVRAYFKHEIEEDGLLD
jgi:hypothetical protein